MNDIPGYFSGSQQIEMIKLLRKYNYPECVGVEVGCMHGRSSFAISVAINKGTLYCIDPWAGGGSHKNTYSDEFIAKHKMPGPGSVNTLETFVKNTESQKNIIPIRGYSPAIVQDWSKSIDFIFLDAAHKNPNDRDNIDFWLPKIKPGGMFSGHDWTEDAQFPDVNLNVEYMEDLLKQRVTIIPNTFIWYFTLPNS